MKRWLWGWSVAAGAFAALAACMGTDPSAGGRDEDGGSAATPGDAASAEAAEPSLTLRATAKSIVPRDAVGTTIDVSVERVGFEGEVTIAVPDYPSGVEIEPLKLGAGAKQGKMKIRITNAAPPGYVTLELTASSGSVGAKSTVEVMLGGLAGTRDLTFGKDGRVYGPLAGTVTQQSMPRALGVDAEGRVYVLVRAFHDCAVLRYTNRDGQLDGAYGKKGVFKFQSGSFCDPYAMNVAADGSVVIAGAITPGIKPDDLDRSAFALRVKADGSAPDPTFGQNGLYAFTNGTDDAAFHCLERTSTGFLLGGVARVAGTARFLAVRLGTAGALDTTFAKGGVYTTGTEVESSIASSSGVRAIHDLPTDQAFVAVGGAQYPNAGAGAEGTNRVFLIKRTNAGEGAFSFGASGTQNLRAGDNAGFEDSVSAGLFGLPNGSFLVSGSAFRDGTNTDQMLLKISAGGGYDSGFGAGTGKAVLAPSGGALENLAALAGIPDGRFYASGTAYAAMYLARFRSDGALDDTFGTAGSVIDKIGTGANSGASVVVHPDGRILVAVYTDGQADFGLERYFP